MNIFEELKELAAQDCNLYLNQAKKTGKRIMGYFCSYVPLELLHAAGFIPYRMRAVGSRGTTRGDTYFSSMNCSFVRRCFDKALEGDFDFLDGVIFMNGCDHTRRMYDNWRNASLKPDFLHMFPVPHTIADPSLLEYTEEIYKLKEAIEKRFDLKISDAALNESIKLYNRERQLLQMIYESRKQPAVPIKGSEMLQVLLAVTALPVEISIKMLEKVCETIKGRKVNSDDDIRIYLASSYVEEPEHLDLIEEAGGIIVEDCICLGLLHFDTLVEETEHPVDSLAKRYLTHMSCPRMVDDYQRRLDHIKTAMDEYKIEAVLVERLEFCSLWAGASYLYSKELKNVDFPIISMDRQLYGGATGQIKTRVQAFFEEIRNKRRI